MKLILTSDNEIVLNAEKIDKFYVTSSSTDHGEIYYALRTNDIILCVHTDYKKAVKAMLELADALSHDNLPLLYCMRDTD